MSPCKLVVALLFAACAGSAWASKVAYDQAARVLEQGTDSWMKTLADDLPLSAISIPGTHDSLGISREFAPDTQGIPIKTQLDLGIRSVDLYVKGSSIRYLPNGTTVDSYHDLEDNLAVIAAWLTAHPSETVLVRVDGSLDQARMTVAMNNAWANPRFAPFFWRPQALHSAISPAIPNLGAVRGRMVLIQGTAIRHLNLSFVEQQGNPRFEIQNSDHLSTNWALYDKWTGVKTFMATTAERWPDGSVFSTNSLHGWGGSAAWFVASGNITWATGSPNLATGYVSRYGSGGWEDFPRAGCTFDEGWCWIMFEGINPLVQGFIETARPNHVGIVRADYPGRGLINAIIDLNRSSSPPVQLAWGDSGRCIDVSGGVFAGSSDIVSSVCDAKSASQQWLFTGDGLLRSFADPRRCVTASRGQSPGSRLAFSACEPGHSPYWLRAGSNHLAADGAPELCIEPLGGSLSTATPMQLGRCLPSTPRQEFAVRRLPVPLVAGHGTCLEFAGQEASANTRACVDGLDRQQWLLREDGQLSSTLSPNGCITWRADDTARPLVNEPCAAMALQRWDARPDGSLRPQTRRAACLTLRGEGTATVAPCVAGASSQRLSFTRDAVQLRWHTNRCLAVNSRPDSRDTTAMARPCSAPDTGWRHLSDQTLRVAALRGTTPTPQNGQCLGLDGKAAVNTSVVVGACVAGSPTQRWVAMPDRTLRPDSGAGLCLDAPGALTGDHHRLKLAPCRAAYAAQRWTSL